MKAFFQARAPREKVLLVAFVALVLASVAAHAFGRARRLWQDRQAARVEAEVQQVWLDHADEIAARAAAAARSFDSARTVNATRLVAELNGFATQAGLAVDIGALRTEKTDRFSFHSVQVNIRRTDLPTLLRFYTALAARSPYLALDQFTLATDRTNPGQLNANLRVVSVELAP